MDDKEQQIWDIYYSGIVGWQFHPGTHKDGCEPLTLEECALFVDEMMRVRRQHLCPGSSQED